MQPTPAIHEEQRTLDHVSLLGTWRNTDGAAGGVRWLVLTEHSGRLALRALSSGRPAPHDLGETAARTYADAATSSTAWAFTGTYDTELRSMKMAGYLKGGLLVLTTYHAFCGPAWPVPYWTREFFHRSPAPVPASRRSAPGRLGGHVRADQATAPLGPWQLDPAPLVGGWRNVDPAATRLSSVEIAERDGYLVIRPHGVWTPRRHDWHRTVGSVFAEDFRSAVGVAFTAFFELAVGRVEMVGYLDRRLLTIETATTFEDGTARSPFYVREHFYPS